MISLSSLLTGMKGYGSFVVFFFLHEREWRLASILYLAVAARLSNKCCQ